MKVSIAETQPNEISEMVHKAGYDKVMGGPQTLTFFWTHSTHCWSGSVDGELACMWGLVPPTLLSDQAYLWLVVTDLVEAHRFTFVRHSQRVIDELLDLYPIIVGHCERGNEEAMRWIRWLGGTFGPWQKGFRPFQIRRK